MRILLFFLILSGSSFAQITGSTVISERRQLVSETPFVINGGVNGFAKYELAIDREGNVTSVRILETDIKRTTAKMKIRDYLMTFKFQKGNHYPRFTHAEVRITMIKPVPSEPEE